MEEKLKKLILCNHPIGPLQERLKEGHFDLSKFIDLFNGPSIKFLLFFVEMTETKEKLQQLIGQHFPISPLRQPNLNCYKPNVFEPRIRYFLYGHPGSGKSSSIYNMTRAIVDD